MDLDEGLPDGARDDIESAEDLSTTELRILNSVPDQVWEISELVSKHGDTVVHKHIDAEEIIQLLVLECLDPRRSGENSIEPGKPRDWTAMTRDLNDTFPGLEASPSQIQNFCRRYIIPHIFLPKSFVLDSLIESGANLNVLKDRVELRDHTLNAFREAVANLNQFTEGTDGRLTRTGSSAAEIASLARALNAVENSLLDDLERWMVVPEKRKEAKVGVNINVDVGSAMGKMAGGKVVDADFTEKKD